MSDTLKKIEDTEDAIAALEARLRELTTQHAHETCPYKAGDIVTARGWSHHGKRVRIDVIRGTNWFGWQWEVIGTVLNADGLPGKRQANWAAHHERKS